MEPREPEDLDALLARGRLGGPARERIAARVVDAAAPRARAKVFYLAPAFALAAAAAALLLFVRPPAHDDFRAKGATSAGASGPTLDVMCRTGGSHRCAAGGTLAFRVDEAAEPGFLAAWAEPAEGERVWYFAGADAVPVDAQRGVQILKRGVRLEAEPRMYRVHLVLSRVPLAREQLLALSPASADVVRESIVPLEVIP